MADTHKLSKPFQLPGADKTITEIVLDFDKLTGRDAIFAVREAVAANGGVPIVNAMAFDLGFQAQIASRACGIDAATLLLLPLADFMAMCTLAQAFLLGADSTEASAPEKKSAPSV